MKINNQVTGNMGLYYISFELSKRGWNVIPTSRNAKGVDLVIYNHDASIKHTIQVKALSKRNPVPLGKNINNLIGDFFIIFRKPESPEVFIAPILKIRKLVQLKTKETRIGYWLQIKDYERFKNNWKLIGRGDI